METVRVDLENLIENLDEKYVVVNGVNIRYVVRGTGSPVLLLHGFGEFLETWAFNIGPLSKHYQIYAMDLPGHGLSEKPAIDYSLRFTAKSVTDFMQTVRIEHASLIGHSLGGLISLSIAINSPDKVDKLILVDSGGLTNKVSLQYRLCALPFVCEILVKPTIKASLRQGIKRAFYNPKHITEGMIALDYKYMKMPGAKQAMLSIIRHSTSLNGPRPEVIMLDKLRRVGAPTLLIHGAQDKIIPLKYAQNACRLIPDARLKVIERCGHIPNIEKASEFNEAVIAFLESKELREVQRVR